MSHRSLLRALALAFIISLSLACGSEERPSPPASAAADACATQVAALTEQATAAGSFRYLLDIDEAATPVSQLGRPMTSFAPVIQVVGERITFNNEPMADIDGALRQRMKTEATLIALNRENLPDPNMETPVMIWMANDAPAATLIRILAAIPADFPPRLLVYRRDDSAVYRPPADSPRRVKAFWKKLEGGANDSDRAGMTAEALTRAIAMCAPVIDLFGDLAGLPASDKNPHLLKHAPAALRECQCGAAPGRAMDFTMYHMLTMVLVDAHERRQYWLPLGVASAGATQKELPAGASVADLVRAYDQLSDKEREATVQWRAP